MRAFFRACIKKDIPVAMSQGFSPHLRISFGPPLSLGMTSSDEYLDMYMNEPVDAGWLMTNLQEGLPEGIKIEEVREVERDLPSLTATLNRAVYKIKVPEGITSDIADINNRELIVDVPIGQNCNVRPVDVITGLWPDLGPDEIKLWPIHRERLYSERDSD